MVKRLIPLLAILLWLAPSSSAQWLFGQSSTSTTYRVRSGTADPATCTPSGNNVIFRTDTGELKMCTATNTWTAVGGGGGGGSPGGSGTEVQFRGGASTFSAVTGSSVSGGAVTLAAALTSGINDAGTNTVIYPLVVRHTSTGTAAAGLGTGVTFALEDDGGNTANAARLDALWTDPSDSAGFADMVIRLANNATVGERFRFKSNSTLSITGTSPTISTATANASLTLTPNGTGQVLFPFGAEASPGIAFSSAATRGLYGANGGTHFSIAGSNAVGVTAEGFLVKSSLILGFSAGSTDANASDAAFARISAGLIEVNNGTAGTWRDLKLRTLLVDATLTAGGTTGDQTINKARFSVNFAAAASTLTVTNSLVGTSSTVLCSIGTADLTLKSVSTVAGSGSVLLTGNAAATAETKCTCVVFN
jgi:hypothetical protein